MTADFDELVREGRSVPTQGWDFSWFAGRATEARPPWGYQELVSRRLARADAVLDLQTGGGEVLAGALRAAAATPGTLAATESWRPNIALARAALRPWEGEVLQCADDRVPFAPESYDLVTARHPTVTPWAAIARVLRPGGTFVSQQVGPGSVRELTAAMIGPYEIGDARSPERARQRAESAGLHVTRIEEASLPMFFGDIAAVIVFLRKVIWIVPEFSVDRYREQLSRLHERIRAEGPFMATSERFLIECRRPSSDPDRPAA